MDLVLGKIPPLLKKTIEQLMLIYNSNKNAILQNLALLNNTFNAWTTDIFPISLSPLQALLNTIIKLNESGNDTSIYILALMKGEFENLFSTIKSKTGLTSSQVNDLRKELAVGFSNNLQQIARTVNNTNFIQFTHNSFKTVDSMEKSSSAQLNYLEIINRKTLNKDELSLIIRENSLFISNFIQDNVITLLKNIPSLDFMQQFLSQLTTYPNLNQFMYQINPLLDSIRIPIMNCFDQNAAIDANHQNVMLQFKTNFTNLFDLINRHAEVELTQFNDNQIILKQINKNSVKESSMLKPQENIITTITS
jgi:hypothetical protein